MWHRGRANLTRFCALLKVSNRNIGPEITVHIQQNRIGTGNSIKQLSHTIVWLNLNSVRIKSEAQAFLNYIFGKIFPIKIGVGR